MKTKTDRETIMSVGVISFRLLLQSKKLSVVRPAIMDDCSKQYEPLAHMPQHFTLSCIDI